jgi:hypothetical protein
MELHVMPQKGILLRGDGFGRGKKMSRMCSPLGMENVRIYTNDGGMFFGVQPGAVIGILLP